MHRKGKREAEVSEGGGRKPERGKVSKEEAGRGEGPYGRYGRQILVSRRVGARL